MLGCSEICQYSVRESVLKLLHLLQRPSLSLLNQLIELRPVHRQVALNDLESLVQILLHGLMINQMLLELLSQLGAQHFQVLNLLGGLI